MNANKSFQIASLVSVLLLICIVPPSLQANQTEISIKDIKEVDTSTEIVIDGVEVRKEVVTDSTSSPPKTKIIREADTTRTETVTYDQYLMGVLDAEIGGFVSDIRRRVSDVEQVATQMFKAQGIAANQAFLWMTDPKRNNGSPPYSIGGTASDQAFLVADDGDSPSDITGISQAVKDIVGSDHIKAMKSVGVKRGGHTTGSPDEKKRFPGDFFNATPTHFTFNREQSPCYKEPAFYSGAMRSTLSPEQSGAPICHSKKVGNMVGLSQEGTLKLAAKSQASKRWDHKQILKHYYGPAPPIWKGITIHEKTGGGSFEETYADSWVKDNWRNDKQNWSSGTKLKNQVPMRTRTVKTYDGGDKGDTRVDESFKLDLSFNEIINLGLDEHEDRFRISVGELLINSQGDKQFEMWKDANIFDEDSDHFLGESKAPPEIWTLKVKEKEAKEKVLGGNVGDTDIPVSVQACHEAVGFKGSKDIDNCIWGLDTEPGTMAFQHNKKGHWKNYDPYWKSDGSGNWSEEKDGNLPHWAGTDTRWITTDYYRVGVKKIKIRQRNINIDGEIPMVTKYVERWVPFQPEGGGDTGLKRKGDYQGTLHGEFDAGITVTFTEPVKNASISIGGAEAELYRKGHGHQVWAGTVPISSIPESSDGDD
ncbi:MAG: hypothetical protein ABEJ65_06485, partial [bacterium]